MKLITDELYAGVLAYIARNKAVSLFKGLLMAQDAGAVNGTIEDIDGNEQDLTAYYSLTPSVYIVNFSI